jgi:hypothetical protein
VPETRLYRIRDVIKEGLLSRSTLYRLVREGRVELIHRGKRMAFLHENGSQLIERLAREDAEERASQGEATAQKDPAARGGVGLGNDEQFRGECGL